MTTIDILLLSIIIILYEIMFFLTKKEIKSDIERRIINSMKRENVINARLNTILETNADMLSTIGATAWPLYYLFFIGASFGTEIFYHLIGDDYENWIATWFI